MIKGSRAALPATLRIWEQQLGPEHPNMAASLNGLATLYWQQGKSAEAEPLSQGALHIFEQQLGPEHPYVAPTLNGLVDLSRVPGNMQKRSHSPSGPCVSEAAV